MKAGFSLIGIIVVVVIWILSAIFKRKEEDQSELPPELKPRGQRSPNQPVARNWEEELRRVLEQRPAPPPIVQHVPPVEPRWAPAPFPPPPPQYAAPLATAPVEDETFIHVSLPAPQPRIEPVFHPLAGLTESAQRITEAMTLGERVSRHMGQVTRHHVENTVVVRRETVAEVAELIRSIRTGRGARAAILASIVLGPPRALDGM